MMSTTTFKERIRGIFGKRSAHKEGQRPPGPSGAQIFGSLKEIKDDPLGLLLRLEREYGGIVSVRVGIWDVVVVNEPEGVKRILVDNARNYSKQNVDYQVLKRVLGEGLLTSEGEIWARQRRMIQPIFQRKRLASYAALMVEEGLHLLERWRPLLGAPAPINVAHEMMQATLNIAGRTLFGVDLLSASASIERSFSIVNHHVGKIDLAMMYFGWMPTPANLRFWRARRVLNDVVFDLIETRRRELSNDAPPHRDDLLTLLLQARDEESGLGMDNLQIRDEVMTLLLAGHETTANAMTWTLYLLAQHPEIAEKLEGELDSVLAENVPSIEDIPKLPYTQMVLEESMRLYPPAWGISRIAVEDDQLLGYSIRANTIMIVSPYATQHSHRYWEEPERFWPERFSPERRKDRPKYAYFPFGGGPRMCIGKHFAMIEATLLLATLCRRVRFQLPHGYQAQPEPLITLRPINGLPLLLQPRTP